MVILAGDCNFCTKYFKFIYETQAFYRLDFPYPPPRSASDCKRFYAPVLRYHTPVGLKKPPDNEYDEQATGRYAAKTHEI